VLLDDQTRLDVSSFVSDYDEEFFGSGGLARLRQWLMNGPVSAQKRLGPQERLGPPICRPSKIVCVGLNYRDHAAESSSAELPMRSRCDRARASRPQMIGWLLSALVVSAMARAVAKAAANSKPITPQTTLFSSKLAHAQFAWKTRSSHAG
jgi:hypothetical protein